MNNQFVKHIKYQTMPSTSEVLPNIAVCQYMERVYEEYQYVERISVKNQGELEKID